MNSSPSPAEVSPREVVPATDRSTLLKALVLLAAFVGLAHVPLLLSDAILWDSAPLANAIEEGSFQHLYQGYLASGAPQVYYLQAAIAQMPDYVKAFKVTAFLSLVGATLCIFSLCLR